MLYFSPTSLLLNHFFNSPNFINRFTSIWVVLSWGVDFLSFDYFLLWIAYIEYYILNLVYYKGCYYTIHRHSSYENKCFDGVCLGGFDWELVGRTHCIYFVSVGVGGVGVLLHYNTLCNNKWYHTYLYNVLKVIPHYY